MARATVDACIPLLSAAGMWPPAACIVDDDAVRMTWGANNVSCAVTGGSAEIVVWPHGPEVTDIVVYNVPLALNESDGPSCAQRARRLADELSAALSPWTYLESLCAAKGLPPPTVHLDCPLGDPPGGECKCVISVGGVSVASKAGTPEDARRMCAIRALRHLSAKETHDYRCGNEMGDAK
jgi:hypothetical protein